MINSEIRKKRKKEVFYMTQVKQPASALSSPRFCNMGTFMRMTKVDSAKGLDFVIAGAPFDTASSFRSGSRFGPNAIRNISAMMKPNNVLLQVNIMENLKGGDIGDFPVTPGYIHPTYQAIEEGVTGIVNEDAIPIVLGGDHSITLAELRAVAKKYGPVALVHFDSHSDLCDEVFGQKYNHGTPFRRALEEGLIDPSHSIQIGMRGSLYDPDEHKMAAELGMKLIPGHKVREMGIPALLEQALERVGDKPCFLTFDIDFVDPAYAPGTGTPEVGGFTSWEALQMVRGLKDLNFVGMDMVEVLPAYDHGEITAYLAANLVFEFLSILATKKK
jgi:agmatinase